MPEDSFSVTKVADDQVERAYDVIIKTGQWLTSLGRRQRISETGFGTYRRWQAAGANYVVTRGDQIAGVFSLVKEPTSAWPNTDLPSDVMWLRALATHPDFRGQGVGTFAIEASLQVTGRGNPLYLDCVSEFLPEYYMKHEFELIAEQTIQWQADTSMQISLLRHANN